MLVKFPTIVQNHKVTSFSMPTLLHERLAMTLPHYGDRSKLIVRLVELWLNRDIHVPGLCLRSLLAQDQMEDLG